MALTKQELCPDAIFITDEWMDYFERRRELAQKVDDAPTKVAEWNAIREFYSFCQERILASKPNVWGCAPYVLHWFDKASPIEQEAWRAIRACGIVMYPQYPIGQHFADFANPALKIVLELDGAQFHDANRDAKRDKWMIENGWRIYRVTGSECVRHVCGNEWEQLEEKIHHGEIDAEDAACPASLKTYAMSTVWGVIEGIASKRFKRRLRLPLWKIWRRDLVRKSARNHLVNKKVQGGVLD